MATRYILVVDDLDVARVSLRRFLEAMGDVVVATANDVEGARAALTTARFDGVVADLAFDGDPRGGVTVLEFARSRDDERGEGLTELLLITGGKDIVAANHAEALGARFLHKPVEPSALARFVDRVRARAALSDIAVEEVSRIADRMRLPARIREVFLFVVARGSATEICSLMRISESTLKTYLNTLLRELRRVVGINAKDSKDVALEVLSRVVRVQRSLPSSAAGDDEKAGDS